MCTRVDTSGKHIIETITTLVKDSTKLVVNKNEIANAVIWLEYAGILSLCNLAVDGDMRKISEGRRVYFSDCGIASYLASKSMINQSSLTGLITETFVYNELHRLFKVPYSKSKVIEEEVCFSTYGQYELDFMIADKHKTVYGIEVKTKDGEPNSLRVYINKGFVDKGIVAKPSKGGHGDYYDTIPIYTVGCRFPYK
jgi:predicted AAA+ superfamily ATPase